MRKKLLDLCCCAGGASRGYADAGFEVVGVDIEDQPAYPYEFYKADALDFLARENISDFSAIHASWPCQQYSPLHAYNEYDYPDLVGPGREALEKTGLPFVMENVVQAPLINPVMLCGPMFGLKLYRHRGFETGNGFSLPPLPEPEHKWRCVRNGYLPTAERPFMSIHGGKHSKAWQRKACEHMGTPWMTTIREVCESIPPAYTRWAGSHLMEYLK